LFWLPQGGKEMIWAIKDNKRVPPNRGGRAFCPACNGIVLAKCGEIVSHHWAHEKLDCDTWSEPESDWHIRWKSEFPKDWQEVKIGNHRADVKTPTCVIEFQNSPISSQEIQEREQFYGRMVWVVNGESFEENFDERLKYDKSGGRFFTFRWKHPRTSWFASRRRIFLDFSENAVPGRSLFEIKKLYPKVPCGGWGIRVDRNIIKSL
jgi:competence CoiA-like predicted nuclease